MELWKNLAVALALGLLIGIERGWQEREAAEGSRIAGIRTFGLISLLGGIWALIAQDLGPILLGFAFLGFVAVLLVAHKVEMEHRREYGITTIVAALITFGLGALCVRGGQTIAAAVAVVTAVLLSLKPVLHTWLKRLERAELVAAFKLLLISVVLLPVLPDEGYGPWQALNPHQIWWFVVLIAGLSFIGYFAIKMAGPRLGIMFTALFGGLASSTVVTLNFSRLGRRNKVLQTLLAAGTVVAAGTMFPRILVEVSVVNVELLPKLIPPLAAMTLVSYLAGLILWRANQDAGQARELNLPNPFELFPALQFGLVLVVVMLLAKAFQLWFGDLGIYLLAAASGLADVDAITLSLAKLAHNGLGADVAVRAIVLAAMVNAAVKALFVASICGGVMARRVGLVTALTILAGLLVLAPPLFAASF